MPARIHTDNGRPSTSTPAIPGIPFSLTLGDTVLNYRILGTNAESAFDGFGTISLGLCYEPDRINRGNPEPRGRIVAIREEHLDWQLSRYGSGLHQTWELSECHVAKRVVLDIIMKRLAGGNE